MQPEVRFMPDNVVLRVRPGMTLLDASRAAKAVIRTRCGGKAACLMCKVKVADQAGLSPLNRNERIKLGSLVQQGYRLSCQAAVLGDVTADIPEDPLKAVIRRQLELQRRSLEERDEI